MAVTTVHDTTDSLDQAGAVMPRRVSILGATGSIGCNTLDLIGRNTRSFIFVVYTEKYCQKD